MGDVFIPALSQSERWGDLKGREGEAAKQSFLGKLSAFVAVLSNAQASIADAVELTPCSHPGLAALSSPSEILVAAKNAEVVEAAESCAQKWCKEIVQVSSLWMMAAISLTSQAFSPADPHSVRTDEEGVRQCWSPR